MTGRYPSQDHHADPVEDVSAARKCRVLSSVLGVANARVSWRWYFSKSRMHRLSAKVFQASWRGAQSIPASGVKTGLPARLVMTLSGRILRRAKLGQHV